MSVSQLSLLPAPGFGCAFVELTLPLGITGAGGCNGGSLSGTGFKGINPGLGTRGLDGGKSFDGRGFGGNWGPEGCSGSTDGLSGVGGSLPGNVCAGGGGSRGNSCENPDVAF